MSLTGKDLDEQSDRLRALSKMVWFFGVLALRLPVLNTEGRIQAGAYRVSDVFVAENVPRSGKGGKVTMNGPRASDLL